MTGVNADSISQAPTQINALRSLLGKPPRVRICLGCPADISHRHGNLKWCEGCRTLMRQTHDRQRRVSPVTCRAIVSYMEQHTPKALAQIKEAIKAQKGL